MKINFIISASGKTSTVQALMGLPFSEDTRSTVGMELEKVDTKNFKKVEETDDYVEHINNVINKKERPKLSKTKHPKIERIEREMSSATPSTSIKPREKSISGRKQRRSKPKALCVTPPKPPQVDQEELKVLGEAVVSFSKKRNDA